MVGTGGLGGAMAASGGGAGELLAGTGHLTALDAGGTGGLRTRCLPDGGARPEVEEL